MYNEVRQGTSVTSSRSIARDWRCEGRGQVLCWGRTDTIYEAVLGNTVECSTQTNTKQHLAV